MSNVCSNYITVEGSPQNLSKLLTYFVDGKTWCQKELDLKRLEKEQDTRYQRKYFSSDLIYAVTKNRIIITACTDWEPCLKAFSYLSDTLNLTIVYIYDEHGCDNCGRAIIRPNQDLRIKQMKFNSKELKQVLMNFKYLAFDYFKSLNFETN